ncbi:MAG: asparagine--tRNA ligase [Planctomycetia bacterium]|nr:asparagine--tRNA ligase [Planctomycetia bacterium]
MSEKMSVKSARQVEAIGKDVFLQGWVRTCRDQKAFCFIELNDGSCFGNIQIVAPDSLSNFDDVRKLTSGSSVAITGKVVQSPGSKQPTEVQAEAVEIYGYAAEDYPIQKKRATFEYLRTIAHLRPRTNSYNAVFRVRSRISYAIHQFFQSEGFNYVHTPLITASDCEGAGEMFQVTTMDLENLPRDKETGKVNYSQDFFGKKTSLTVSGQLAVENFAHAFGKVYTFGPTFRAENSNTPRHLAEFWMIEPEMAFFSLEDNMELVEKFLKFLIKTVLEDCPEDMQFFNDRIDPDHALLQRLQDLLASTFQRCSYTEAIEILKAAKQKFEYKVEWGIDLQSEHERYLTEKHFKAPVIVYNYPKEIKAFYMRLNDDEKTVRAMDVLVPGVGEIIGGSEREYRPDVLEKRMVEMGLNPEDYWWYMDLRRFGTVPHSGFGLGLERIIMYVTGMQNVRDVIPFPRTPGSAEF